MAKQFVISAMEEVMGEYILNISKENLRIAAVKGEIKLENVQLDGDLVGSHFLGPVGLTSFGVLSCSAKSIRISLPWKKLEKEPTKIEVDGVHLICVPLIHSTANQIYGAGTPVDPRCSLRTRAKRLALARFERNYWSGQISGEGPPLKRVVRAVHDVERELKKSKRNWRKETKNRNQSSSSSLSGSHNDASSSLSGSHNDEKSSISTPDDFSEMEDALDELVNSLTHERETPTNGLRANQTDTTTLPNLPRDWKVKLREKVMRNLEATMTNIHIRCEVGVNELSGFTKDGKHTTKSPFSFGFTIERIIVRTANEKWEVGSHDKNSDKRFGIASSKDHLGPNEYVVVNNKIGYVTNASFYWDENPPFLLSETDALKGNYQSVSSDKISSEITTAMDVLCHDQEPGTAIRQAFGLEEDNDGRPNVAHNFIFESFNVEMRVRTSDRTCPGPISCSVDVLPFSLSFNFLPYQVFQYNRLKSAILSQQRFDTMLKQRPFERPIDNPHAWWKYAIACVMSRPNSRRWEDVLPLVQRRERYIELVSKKNSKASGTIGYHVGLLSEESSELLAMEDLMPIEALLAFHTVALRKVYTAQKLKGIFPDDLSGPEPKRLSEPTTGKRPGRFRIPRLTSASKGKNRLEHNNPELMIPNIRQNDSGTTDSPSGSKSASLFEAMTLRLGRKVWFVDWKVHDASINVLLKRDQQATPLLNFLLRGFGRARSYGVGRRDFLLDISQFDILHHDDKILFVSPVEENTVAEEESVFSTNLGSSKPMKSSEKGGPDLKTPSAFLELPPLGSLCRVAYGKEVDRVKLSISAHPATLVWTTSLFKGIADFLSDHLSGTESDLTEHIRNAATPLARKAQLAFLSPSALSVHLNIAAPKVWVPLVSREKEGTLFVDAGTIRVASVKNEGETDAQWEFRARDIGVTFVRGVNVAKLGKDGQSYFWTYGVPYAPIGKNETSVIKPLSVTAKSRKLRDNEADEGDSRSSTNGRILEIDVSPICLSLVDAEMLARSFGKWYGIGLRRVRRQAFHSNKKSDGYEHFNGYQEHEGLSLHETRRILSLSIDKIEMALEGHSKTLSSSSDDRSTISQDSILELAPPTRAYVVELFNIALKRTTRQNGVSNTLSVADASIVRLKDVSLYHPLKLRRHVVESENCVLSRVQREASEASHPNVPFNSKHVCRASLFHNRVTHADEVEVDVDSLILRVTPTTLKDCSKAVRRIIELAQILTKEMERKVHEEGRRARKFDLRVREHETSRLGSVTASIDRPISPTMSDVMTEITAIDYSSSGAASMDSSILFRVTLRECTLLAGKPTRNNAMNRSPSFVVVQIVSNAKIMFQSIENSDASGSKTLHISVDNVSALLNTEFKRVPLTQAPPMIEPTGAEFRIKYTTENFGCVVAQDISLDCEAIKACLTPNDLLVMMNISRTMYDRFRAIGVERAGLNNMNKHNTFIGNCTTFIRYQKKGTGIATKIRGEIQNFSFVLLKAYKSYSGAPEFLDFSAREVKILFQGCMSALSGECAGLISVNFFNSDLRDWEYAVEPVSLGIGIEQVPNEVVLNVAPSSQVQLNLSGVFLREFSEVLFEIRRDRLGEPNVINGILHPSALSTVGLRQASVNLMVNIHNSLGIDIQIIQDSSLSSSEPVNVKNHSSICLQSISRADEFDYTVSLRIPHSSSCLIGERESLHKLPITRHGNLLQLYLLKPVIQQTNIGIGQHDKFRCIEGRSTSLDTVLSEGSAGLDWGYYNAEPVVEWCMQNQRLRPSLVDMFSLPKGRDLLSNQIWSPEEVFDTRYDLDDRDHKVDTINGNICKDHSSQAKNQREGRSNWIRPFLVDDSPEWSDMTCMLSMDRERIMLPDNRWTWLDDWSVDVDGKLLKDLDADGWSYATDFGSFMSAKRYYVRGATCRRRRWTRMRMLKPPKFDDPFKQMKFVWQNVKEENGSITVHVRSHIKVINNTPYTLSIFAFAPSWTEDKLAGTVTESDSINIPIQFATATHMRIGKKTGVQSTSLSDFVCSQRFLVLPSSHTSSRHIRTFIDLADVCNNSIHFLIQIRCVEGVIDIVIDPVFRIINLLPCQLECHIGEKCGPLGNSSQTTQTEKNHGKNVHTRETLKIQSGKAGVSTNVSPWLKPHISVRVPGYKWSQWNRIINRNTDTWRPSEKEEVFFSSKANNENIDELQTLIRLDRYGRGRNDTLVIIMGVESNHSPVIRIFAQYWILDKTGFGCQFSEGFSDLLSNVPDRDTSRRSYMTKDDEKIPEIKADLNLPGHQWSLGKSGMTLYFSRREKLTLSIETGIPPTQRHRSTGSKWISPLDVSNVIPKTVFSVDERIGSRRFELAINVTMCAGPFGRTKLITLLPRYQIVNLLHRELLVCQDGCPDKATRIASQSTSPLHWENGKLEPKIRLGAPSIEERVRGQYQRCWTRGRVQVDRVGITSMRLPSSSSTVHSTQMVVQSEVRLATQDQSSAVVIVIWSGDEKSNPLYMLRNRTQHTILCRQALRYEDASHAQHEVSRFECGVEISPILRSYLGIHHPEEFVWKLKSGEYNCFGLENPEKPHIIQWEVANSHIVAPSISVASSYQDIDAMGSSSTLLLSRGRHLRCQICAEHSTKVIEFVEVDNGTIDSDFTIEEGHNVSEHHFFHDFDDIVESRENGFGTEALWEDENIAVSLQLTIPALNISVIDNAIPSIHGREILLLCFEKLFVGISQSREGYHEFELKLDTFQVDNHVPKSVHPVLVFCPRLDDLEPLLHMSAVRRLQLHSTTRVFRYAAIRLLEIDVYLDRSTAEVIARFIQPMIIFNDLRREKPLDWLEKLSCSMKDTFGGLTARPSREIEKLILTANSGRIYFEQLHLHPVRISLTFTQEWMDWNQSADTVMIFQFIRGMASIASAPLVFNSFVVGHVFEAPEALLRILVTHYSSQLTKQIFGIIGSLAILGAPADFISNVGSGVRDFFYEPIQGAVHGPRQFIEGLEAGTQSLARGVFVGVVRGAANVTGVVNSNLAGLTTDDDFLNERKAHQRMLTDALSRGTTNRTFADSLNLACASLTRGVKSGAIGMIEQPAVYASKHGPVGFLKGVGKAMVGALVKPVVGLGDGVVLVMNHMSDATSKEQIQHKIPKRLRRALPCIIADKPNCVALEPYDQSAAKAQAIVTGGESLDDVYLGHVNIQSHLIIASEESLWAIDKISFEPWCVSWREISHFRSTLQGIYIMVFSQLGLKTYTFQVENEKELQDLQRLLAMYASKMSNNTKLNSKLHDEDEILHLKEMREVQSYHLNHVFGSVNNTSKRLSTSVKDEIDLVEQCFVRVREMSNDGSSFLQDLDAEAWNLVSSWGHVFSGLSSRRCVVVGIINRSKNPIQIKAAHLIEGGSSCYSIPTKEFNMDHGFLHAGGVILFFGWGVSPSLMQSGNILMYIETNACICTMSDQKSRDTGAFALPGYQVGFLEKSYDDNGWWAKYWLLIQSQ